MTYSTDKMYGIVAIDNEGVVTQVSLIPKNYEEALLFLAKTESEGAWYPSRLEIEEYS